MQFAKNITLQLLRAYKWAISPLLPHACRYVPTCSEYAMEAVERYGALRGMWMAIGRLLRCHPFAGSGYDPVVGSPIAQSMTVQSITQSAGAKYFQPCGQCAPRT
jgi:putative membrane protein insertion efficiency factor